MLKLSEHIRLVARTYFETFVYNIRDRRCAGMEKSSQGVLPLISIIVPTLCKNEHAHRITDLHELLSIYLPAQTYSHYEVLVISDGPNAKVKSLVDDLSDERVRYMSTEETTGFGGLPETSLGFEVCGGQFCLRMNDDNRPYPNYLDALLSGFRDDVDFTFARVVFSDEARAFWGGHFSGMSSYILPNDKDGTIHENNVDWMNFMFRTETARVHRAAMCTSWYGDWAFISELIAQGIPGRFVDRLVGHKR